MNTTQFQKYYDMLNPEQREAVDTLDGPVMVIAGPGTGKTQIIGTRTANIILKTGVHPENILITTFTEAGVTAIRERLISMIGGDAYRVHIATIHSFAQDVIKTFPEKFTIEKLDTPIDDIESMEIISDIVLEFLQGEKLEYLTSYGDRLFYLRDIKGSINNLKREGILPEKFLIHVDQEEQKSLAWLEEKRNNKRIKKIEKYEQEHEKNIGKLRELYLLYVEYNKILRERHLYDFNDMINFVLERFETDEILRQYYAETYQYVMLDEYQDTNNPQNEIIRHIMSVSDEAPNIMVVGDDDQSIYRFQGANIENMLDFTTSYPDAKIIVLDKNYRSAQYILDGAKNLIEENSERLINRLPGLEKNLVSQIVTHSGIPSLEKGEDLGESGLYQSQISLYLANSDIDERLYILEKIQQSLKSGVSPEEIAIIVRNNAEIVQMSEFLSGYNIPSISKLENNILENEFVIWIIKFLGLLHSPKSNEKAFLDILRSNIIDVDALDILKISDYLYRKNYAGGKYVTHIIDVISRRDILSEIGVIYPDKLQVFLNNFLDAQTAFSQHNILLGFSQFLDIFDITNTIKKVGNFYDIQDVYSFFHTLKSWGRYISDLSIEKILKKIDLYHRYGYRLDRSITTGTKKGVQLVTAHSSKGLEYEYVYIPGLYTGNWDDKFSRNLIKLPESIVGDGLQFALLEEMSDAEKKTYYAQRQAQEDRRLFFVAVSRAKKYLSLSFPATIEGKQKIISPFVGELGDVAHIASQTSLEKIEAELARDMLQKSPLISYSQTELEYIENFLKSYSLSASDLNTFLLNPQDFLLGKVFRYPFEQNENSLFGTMYHRTLELFYKQILETGETPDIAYMKHVFESQLDREFLTGEEYNRLKKRGFEGLEGYYTTYTGNFGIPLKTEFKFSRKNIFFENIPITGIIDKIELLDGDMNSDVSNGTLFSQRVKIVDYKTGSIKYPGEILGIDKEGNQDITYEKGRYGRQLMFYRLLFENTPDLYQHYVLESLELDFCEGKNGKYKQLPIEFDEEQYEAFKKLVAQTYATMTDIEFWKDYLQV